MTNELHADKLEQLWRLYLNKMCEWWYNLILDNKA